MTVEVWADFVCPWCYIAEARFGAARALFPHRDEVRVTRRSFELDPDSPRMSGQTPVQMLTAKYHVSPEQAAAMEERVSGLARAEGLRMHADRAVANTSDAHRLLRLAAAAGKAEALTTRLYHAHFEGRLAIDDPTVLAAIAAEVDLDPSQTRDVLTNGRYREEVAEDRREAHAMGATGVPLYVLDRKYAVSGAQAADVFLEALTQAWEGREGP